MTVDPVCLYLWHLNGPVADLSACLSAEENARADRFVRPEDAHAYRVGRGRLRHILAGWVGGAPDVLRFETGAMGKPRLVHGPSFNLSHSGGLACLAVHADLTLGLDIEAPRPIEEGVARRFFSPAEYGLLCSLPAEEWLPGFYRCWTRKEAVVKATGVGLGARLDAFDVTLGPYDAPAVTRIETGDTTDWALAHLDISSGPGPGWTGALAVPDPGAPLTFDLRLCPDDITVHWVL